MLHSAETNFHLLLVACTLDAMYYNTLLLHEDTENPVGLSA